MRCGNVFALHIAALLAALCLPESWAATCTGGACLRDHDEVSFVQMKESVVKKRKKEPRHPRPASDNVELVKTSTDDAQPDAVIAAYETNLHKVKSAIAGNNAEDLSYKDREGAERMESNRNAIEQANEYVEEAAEEIGELKASVEDVAAERRQVKKEAEEQIANAKRSALEHREKMHQVDQADVAGRLEGARQGFDEAARQNREAESTWEQEREARAAAALRDATTQHQDQVHDSIHAATNKKDQENRVWADHVGSNTAAAIEHSKANAQEAEEQINGPEGIKNILDQDYAARVKRHVEREISRTKERIEKADATEWP